MTETATLALAMLILAAAMLYASVGHGGGSAYLAAMALMGVASEVMKPTALTLNVLVATIGTVQFYRAGCFNWRLFWPFAAASVPLAFMGGRLMLPGGVYGVIVGLALLVAAWRLFGTAGAGTATPTGPPTIPLAMVCGGGIGLLSGLTGVGGGIFLSPLLILARWSDARAAAGVSAPFILVNSIAGLAGHLSAGATLPTALPLWAAAALIGGAIGAHHGSRRFAGPVLRKLLALVLVIAAGKLILT